MCGKTWWQWLFASASAVYHTIVPTRGKAVPVEFLGGVKPKVWISDRLPAQCKHAEAHQFCLAHLIRDAQYAIDAGDTVFAPGFKAFLKRACAIGRKRPEIGDATIARHARDLKRELDRLLDLRPTNGEGIHLQAAIAVDARDKLLVFLTRRDVEPTNNVSERGIAAIGDLPQGHELLPIPLGRESLRRSPLHCRNRPPRRPEPAREPARRPGPASAAAAA